MPRALCLALCMGAGLLSGAQVLAQPMAPLPYREAPEWLEMGVTPPAYPKAENLIKFPTTWTNSDILVDRTSFSVGDDAVVRYVLVIKTAGGAENVTFEGLRCATGQRRIYAFGRRDQTWSPSKAGDWRPIEDTRTNRHHFEFWRDVFCDGKATEPRDVILRNVVRGGRERPQSIPSD
jgi:hypothetical protein